MNRIKRFFLSRTTILTLFLLAIGAMLVGSIIPQSFLLTKSGLEKWHADYPVVAPLAERLGLTRVYTHPLFAVILLLVIVSLLYSCIEQFKASWRRTYGETPAPGGTDEFRSFLTQQDLDRRLRSSGYLRANFGEVSRYLRHPWGFWGNCLLHFGMLVVIASSLWIAVTQKRGLLQLVEGETHLPTQPWVSMEKGLLARDFALAESVRLDRLNYEFWPTFGVKTVASTITFLKHEDPVATHTVEINSILGYLGLRIYQGIEFGHAFYLEVTDPSGRKEVFQLLVNHQMTPDKPSYNDFVNLLGEGKTLRVKYFVNEEKRSLTREDPLLVVRLDQGAQQVDQLPLKLGAAGSIGPYKFNLLRFSRWSSLYFVKLTGISGIFLGFSIIVLGGSLNYFTPPREILVKRLAEGGMLITWRAGIFAEFYRDEFERLRAELTGEKSNG